MKNVWKISERKVVFRGKNNYFHVEVRLQEWG